jgi:putative Mg2+ transporter-C (MgtC) family protein
MLTFEQMAFRLVIAILLGSLIGIEREIAGREAGLKTGLTVAAGAALFTMVGLNLPYIIALSATNLPEVIARNSGFLAVIANIVVGVGFLGAGVIMKMDKHVHGLTTAAGIWVTAAVGVLVGMGLIQFAAFGAALIAFLFYIIRKSGIEPKIRQSQTEEI